MYDDCYDEAGTDVPLTYTEMKKDVSRKPLTLQSYAAWR